MVKFLPAAPEDEPAREAADSQARAILVTLHTESQRFAELAQAHSRCPSAAQGGNLGQVTTGQTAPEFERALAAMEPGTLRAEPVSTRYGLHIIRLERRIDGPELPFEAVWDRIAAYFRESVERRATEQYVARLVSRADIGGIEIEGAEAHRVS